MPGKRKKPATNAKKSKRISKPDPPPKKAKKKRGRPKKKLAVDWAPAFLKALLDGQHVRDACKRADIDGSLPYQRREIDEAFKAAWIAASRIGTEAIEDEACRRAYYGVEKPVYYVGEEVGRVLEYSDQLIIFLLRARDPKKYRENSKIEQEIKVKHSGSIENGPNISPADVLFAESLAEEAENHPADAGVHSDGGEEPVDHGRDPGDGTDA